LGINIRRMYGHKESADTLLNRFIATLEMKRVPFVMQIANNLIILKVTEEESKWWSPELNLRIEREEEGSMIYEVVGPNASTFTLAMFFILFSAVVFIAAFIMMLAQMQIGIPSGLALAGTMVSGIMVV